MKRSAENLETLNPSVKKTITKTPETIDDILDLELSLRKKDVENLCKYIKYEIDLFEEEFGCSPNEEYVKELFAEYNYDELTLKLSRSRPVLEKINNMIGMDSIKKTVVDLILYYIQDFHRKNEEYLHTVITGPPGCGKCLSPETEVRTFTGELIKAKDILPDMYLMGELGEPRKVVSTATGIDQMYLIKQSHGESYIVNSCHILTLISKYKIKKVGDLFKIKYADINGIVTKIVDNPDNIDFTIDIELGDYMKKSDKWKSWFRGYKTVFDYFADKTISERIEYLEKNSLYNIIFADETNKDKIIDIIWSLGWYCEVEKITNNKYSIKWFNNKLSKIDIQPLGLGYYCGFELEFSDLYGGRFLLKDFTVTHNTTIANLLGELYSKLGILETSKFTHLSRSDLIAKYLGQSAIKTKEALTECLGGVAFIDEAYSLAPNNKDKDSFAKEVIDTLNQFLSEHKDDFVCILAGYKEDLESSLFAMNKGLERRFPWRFNIEAYNSKDLTKILYKKVEEMEWKIIDGLEIFLEDFFRINEKYFKHFGGDIETFLTKCKFAHVKRVFVSGEKKIFTKDDFEKGIIEHKKHYGKKEENSAPFGMYV